jgi:hypothetical protein
LHREGLSGDSFDSTNYTQSNDIKTIRRCQHLEANIWKRTLKFNVGSGNVCRDMDVVKGEDHAGVVKVINFVEVDSDVGLEHDVKAFGGLDDDREEFRVNDGILKLFEVFFEVSKRKNAHEKSV